MDLDIFQLIRKIMISFHELYEDYTQHQQLLVYKNENLFLILDMIVQEVGVLIFDILD